MSSQKDFSIGDVTSNDGTVIGYRRIGRGSSLVIVPGTARTSTHYDRLAESLANQFTVYVMDRRGRGNSGPQNINYSLKKKAGRCCCSSQKGTSYFFIWTQLRWIDST